MKKVEVMGSSDKNKQTSSWIENPLVEWVLTQGQAWLWTGAAILLIGLFFLVRMLGGSGSGINDYLQTQTDVISLVQLTKEENQENRKAILDNLKGNLKKHPELHARYDGIISQTLLIQNMPKEAEQFEMSALNQLQREDLTNFQQFAENSLLISNQKYQEALTASFTLKDNLIKQAEKNTEKADSLSLGDTLFAFNLLRIAVLQQQVGSVEGEKEAWKEWQKYSIGTPLFSKQAFQTVSSLFDEGRVKLENYIKGTEK